MFKGTQGKFINKHKKSIIIFLLFIVTIIRIWMISDLPFGVQAKRINDQYLMLRLSESIINGEWLGGYSESILVKGLVYPLLMAACHYSKIPFHIFFTLIYIFSVFIVTLSLTKHLKFVSRVFLYLVLLFNPVSYAGQTFMEVYRNSLGMSFALLFIAGLIFIYDTRTSRYKFIVSSFYLGVVIALVSNTREDGIWMAPALLIFLVVMFVSMKNLKIRFFSMIILLTIPLFQFNSMVKYENLKHYNISYVNEMTKGYYPKVFLDILQIDVGKRTKYHSFTFRSIESAFKNSDTLNSIKKDFLKEYKISGYLNESAMWSFRNFIYDTKEFKDGKEADEYFNQVYLELEEAYEKGNIKRDKRVLSIFTNYFNKDDFIPIIKKTFYSAYYSATYKDIKFYYIRMDDKENVSKLFNTYSNSEVNSDRYNTSFTIFKFLLKVYKNVFPIFSIVGLIIYLNLLFKFIFRKDRNIVFFISTVILVSYFSLLFIMSYTDVISFETIMPYYLVPIYSLQILFIMTLLLSKCEEIKSWRR